MDLRGPKPDPNFDEEMENHNLTELCTSRRKRLKVIGGGRQKRKRDGGGRKGRRERK